MHSRTLTPGTTERVLNLNWCERDGCRAPDTSDNETRSRGARLASLPHGPFRYPSARLRLSSRQRSFAGSLARPLCTRRFPSNGNGGGTFGSMSRRRQRHTSSLESSRDANHPLVMWPMAHAHSERLTAPGTRAEQTAAGPRQERNDIQQLAGALRAAKRAHRAYVAELRQGDVEPAEDWSTWYAEYLLGQR